ncbi:hypothetical protein PSMK_07570 [Phycisphaera mikurensis NBRC 102666]|uniref:Uncharacterized protein n=1 Tax=Phycisphaera mikurensis (strain NBRC 102666 / KCTC 22515 / FYK2301M01) TaxID=1142394 RepID=I0ICC8_PHYMF|nr:hypothetical protein [Phycisphaera mikurensis]BAM02916.1 hypothetical protein PSMK_07570 [Phycisphaera mikurensis NBRC 102666]
MSADTPAEEPADREANQPESATVRGFFRRSEWTRRVEASGLATASRDLVLATVRATKLRPKEKLAVADELIAHFHDADRQGVNPAEAQHDFGDPAVAAKLIRRAKKRNRGFLSKLKTCVWWALGAFAVFYAVLAIRFYSGEPRVSVDHLARLNAVAAAVPDRERAWPLLQEAMSNLDLPTRGGPPLDASPGDSAWPSLIGFLNEHADPLDTLDAALARPALGWEASLARPPGDADAAGGVAPLSSLMEVRLDHLHQLRNAAGVLRARGVHAAAAGDAAGTAAASAGLLRLANWALEHPTLINALVASSVQAKADGLLAEALTLDPELFSRFELRRLQERVRDRPRPVTDEALLGERLIFEDLLQRMFTDDGRGGGRITPEGVRGFATMLGAAGSLPGSGVTDSNPVEASLLPLALLVSASRSDLAAVHRDAMDAAAAGFRVPLHQAWELPTPAALDAAVDGPLGAMRYGMVTQLLPALDATRRDAFESDARRDAALLALALHRHRLATGSFPEPSTGYAKLVPAYLHEIPLDPLHGTPMRWTIRDGRPVIYGLGADGDDDGGVLPTEEAGGNRAAFAPPEEAVDGDWIAWPPGG